MGGHSGLAASPFVQRASGANVRSVIVALVPVWFPFSAGCRETLRSCAARGVMPVARCNAWSLRFGIKDDIVIRVRPLEAGSAVDVCSLSRIGGSDIGANA